METFAVEPAIAAQEPITLFHRVGADEKIRHHALAFSTTGAISPPSSRSRDNSVFVHQGKADTEGLHGSLECGRRGKCRGGLHPNHFAGDDCAFREATSERTRRSLTEFCIGAKDVQQDVGVDSSDQGLPRSSAIKRSIERPRPRQP